MYCQKHTVNLPTGNTLNNFVGDKTLERGTETSYNSSPDFTQEFDRMQFKWDNNEWYSLQKFFGNNYSPLIESGYFVDQCGANNSMENYYHIETGKGTARNC